MFCCHRFLSVPNNNYEVPSSSVRLRMTTQRERPRANCFYAKSLRPRFVEKFASNPPAKSVKFPIRSDMDQVIEAKELQIERKHFHVELRENDRGRFLRITEEAHGRRNTIIVPSTGAGEFTAAIEQMLATSEGLSPAS
ncbi:MAG: hypothetical protein ABR589_04705 [Chthoniobacterales bacterium]